ncbi:MAG: hypothetical protein AAF560_30290 [Acidobacteriota bacterium]
MTETSLETLSHEALALETLALETPAWLAALHREQQVATPYFGLGFEKAQLPEEVHAWIMERVRRDAHRFVPAPSRDEVRSVEPAILPVVTPDDAAFDDEIGLALQTRHEAWAGMTLERSAGGGLRAFQRGAYVLSHVDRPADLERPSPRVLSSTACLAAELDEPWPLRIEDIEGRVHDVDLAPGEVVFYEGARLLHGRPWPLRGDYCLCLTLHYRPSGLGGGSSYR